MSILTAADVPLLVVSDNARSERRISPAWTIDHLKSRLEPITGVPASAQKLGLKVGSWPIQSLEVAGDTLLSQFPLQQYAEIHVRNVHCSPFMLSSPCPRDQQGIVLRKLFVCAAY